MLAKMLVFVVLISFLQFSTVGSEKFLIYSTMDAYFKATFGFYHAPTIEYANKFGYQFLHEVNTFDFSSYKLNGKNPLPHYYRIYAAIQLMSGKISNVTADWIVYLDSDAYFNEDSMPLDAFIDAVNDAFLPQFSEAEQKIPCDLIAQDFDHVVNTGFFLLRNTTWSLDLMKRWLSECDKAHTGGRRIGWVWDQGPFQNALLHVSACLTTYHLLN
jgi:hypothetical protein